MKTSLNHARLLMAGSVLVASAALVADGTRFSDFTPLPASAGPTADESMPITFGNPAFAQRSIADRASVLAGVQRHGRVSGQTDTIWQNLAPGGHVSFDAAYCGPPGAR